MTKIKLKLLSCVMVFQVSALQLLFWHMFSFCFVFVFVLMYPSIVHTFAALSFIISSCIWNVSLCTLCQCDHWAWSWPETLLRDENIQLLLVCLLQMWEFNGRFQRHFSSWHHSEIISCIWCYNVTITGQKKAPRWSTHSQTFTVPYLTPTLYSRSFSVECFLCICETSSHSWASATQFLCLYSEWTHS